MSQSSIANDLEFQHENNTPLAKHSEEQGGAVKFLNGVEIAVKSETSINRADSMKKKTLFTASGLNQGSS